MKFAKEIIIDRPLAEVLTLLEDPEHVKQWQPDLVSITPLSGTPGEAGAKATLAYRSDGRDFELTETVVSRDPHGQSVSTYETKGMLHTVTNHFTALDGNRTKMVSENDMQFSGAMKLMGKMLAKSLRTRAETNIENFKHFAETA
ncbi:SRPBCC family protein [Amycolatopsis nigrescens]|uniref:SRPBCC family protein n=1 Tax=Amycolatopsis nigrescens TaxID=381445 RepID=UPI000366CD1A|nr:SRPBCC family protein [Amycolatopsis nigrescens]